MFKKIKKLKFINLALAACILSTTVAPSAQAMGLFNYLKKIASPSTLTASTENLEVITPSDDIVDITTETGIEIGTEKSSTFDKIFDTIFSSKNAARLFTAITSLAITILLTKKYFDKKVTIEEFKKINKLENVPLQQVEEVKQIAKELGMSDDEIKRIQVANTTDQSTINQFAATCCNSFDLVVIPKNTDDLVEYINLQNPNIKKSSLAHELSHIKYDHIKKREFLDAISYAMQLIGPMLIDKILCEIFNRLKPKNTGKINLGLLKKPALLISCALKFAYLIILSKCLYSLSKTYIVLPIMRIQEKNADLGAASLGADVIIAHIISFESHIKWLDDKFKNLSLVESKRLAQIDGSDYHTHYNRLYETMKKNLKSIDEHPTSEARVKYLEKLLTTDEQKQKLAMEKEKLAKTFLLAEEIEKITKDILRNVEIKQESKQFADEILEAVKVKDLSSRKNLVTNKEDRKKLIEEIQKIKIELLFDNKSDELIDVLESLRAKQTQPQDNNNNSTTQAAQVEDAKEDNNIDHNKLNNNIE